MSARPTAGFTLLETIVALAVFGFLLLGLSQTVRFGLTAWRQETRLSDGKTDLEAVDRVLRSIVENLSPGDNPAQPSIDGSTDSLSGVTRLRVPGSDVMPTWIEAGLTVSGRRLVLRWRPYHHGAALQPPPSPAETELIGGIAELRVAYWKAPGMWVSRWHEPNLPLLIRFRLVGADAQAPRWPDIVVAPLLARP
jgi:general secretion pathway protein J